MPILFEEENHMLTITLAEFTDQMFRKHLKPFHYAHKDLKKHVLDCWCVCYLPAQGPSETKLGAWAFPERDLLRVLPHLSQLFSHQKADVYSACNLPIQESCSMHKTVNKEEYLQEATPSTKVANKLGQHMVTQVRGASSTKKPQDTILKILSSLLTKTWPFQLLQREQPTTRCHHILCMSELSWCPQPIQEQQKLLPYKLHTYARTSSASSSLAPYLEPR